MHDLENTTHSGICPMAMLPTNAHWYIGKRNGWVRELIMNDFSVRTEDASCCTDK